MGRTAVRLAALLGSLGLALACAGSPCALQPADGSLVVERAGIGAPAAAWGGAALVGRAALLGLGLEASRGRAPGERPGLRLRGGAKSKNHTNHNQNRKAHRNGIKRVRTHRNETTKYRAIKMWRNTKYARKGSMRIHRHNLQMKKEEAAAASGEDAGETEQGGETMEA